MAENLELVKVSLKKLGDELRAATQKQKPKCASKGVLQDAVAIAISSPCGLLVAEQWIKFNGVVDAGCLHAAMDRVRESLCNSRACGAEVSDGMSAVVPRDSLLSARARKFLMESKLKSWLETQNLEKGIAPARAQVWQKRLALNDCPGKVAKTKKGQKQWCRRWRTRWGVTPGRIFCREVMSETDMQEKVEGRVSGRKHKPRLVFGRRPPTDGSKTLTVWWAWFPGRLIRFGYKRSPKTVPFF